MPTASGYGRQSQGSDRSIDQQHDSYLVPHQATFARLTIRRRRGSLVWRFRQAM